MRRYAAPMFVSFSRRSLKRLISSTIELPGSLLWKSKKKSSMDLKSSGA